MKEKIMQSFKVNFEAKRHEIKNLQYKYMLLKAQDECTKEMFKESAKEVLKNNIFYAEKSKAENWIKRSGGEFDGRIKTEEETFLMSESDFEKYLKLYSAENYKRGLTKGDGTYTETTNTAENLSKLKNEIIHFAVDLLPDIEEKEILKKAVTPGKDYSYKAWNGVFDLFMKL